MLILSVFIAVGVFLQSQHSASQDDLTNIVYRTEGTALNNTLVFGAIFPVHASGPSRDVPCGVLRASAVQLVESMVLATQIINEDPTLLPNITLAFDIRDTCLSINYALEQSVDYIQTSGVCSEQLGQGPSAVIGPFQSSIAEPAANLFGLFEIPQVSYGSSATLFSSERFSFFFRTIPSDIFQARALVDIIIEYEWEYIILLHSNDLYGNGGSDALQNEMDARNSTTNCFAIQIPLNSNPPNYEEAVDLMNQDWVNNATVVLLFGHLENAIGMLRAIEGRVAENPEFPLQKLMWLGSESWGDNLPDEYRPLVRGMISTVPQSELIQEFDDYFTDLDPINNTANPWFVEYWESEFKCNLGRSPTLPNCTGNQSISPDTINYSQFSLVPLVFDAVFALANSAQDIIASRCPKGDLCSDIAANGVISGSLLRDSISEVSFQSKAQDIQLSFDSNGDVEGSYTVLNLQLQDGQYRYTRVGVWDADTGLSIDKPIEWNAGDEAPESICSRPCGVGEIRVAVPGQTRCCFKCQPCLNDTAAINNRCISCGANLGFQTNDNHTRCIRIPISFLTFSNPWAVVLTILTSIGVVATSVVIVIFLVFYKHELIKASSRELSAILLAGLFLCYIMPFFYIAKPSAAICAIRRFGVGFCFAVSYSALLVKTNRIYRIFSQKQSSSSTQLMFVSPLSQVLITLGLIAVQAVIGIVWLAAERPATEVIASSTSNELTCATSPAINLLVALAYNLILLVLCTYFAFLTRKVPSNFNETKFINVTMYSTGLIWLAFIPTFFATSSLGTIFQTTTLAFGIIFSATTALFCLFISKVILLNSKIRKERKSENTHSQTGNTLNTIANSNSSTNTNAIFSTNTNAIGKLQIPKSNMGSEDSFSKHPELKI